MDWRLFLCVLLTWSLGSASPANRPLDEARSSNDDSVEHLQGLPRSRQKRLILHPAGTTWFRTVTTPGEIRSMYFPDDYPNSLDYNCKIIAAAGQRVLAAFTYFDVENSTSCTADSLKIYDSGSPVGHPVKNFCGASIPSRTLSTGKHMYLSFTTNRRVTARGFKVSITFGLYGGGGNLACAGNEQTLTHSGEIRSPYFPHHYPELSYCQWRIRAPDGNVISLVFLAFNVESQIKCAYDSLKIYNGATSFGEQLANYCGNSLPPNLRSKGRNLFLIFRTNMGGNRSGFKIKYSFDPPSTPGCRYHITSDSEILSSPNFPGDYPDNTDCVWDITAPLGQVITITRVTSSLFYIEESPGCIYDYIAMHDGQSIQDSVIARLCGVLAIIRVVSTSNHLYIFFHTDEHNTRSGFQLAIEFGLPITTTTITTTTTTTTTTPRPCGGQLHGSSGELHSPNYGTSDYPRNTVCVWNIKGPARQIILLEFQALHLEGPSSCQYDEISMYDRDTASGSRLSYYCGNRNRNPPSIRSTGRYMTVKFTSDASVQKPGFSATYRSYRIRHTACDPGRPDIVTLSQGANEMIKSPGNAFSSYPTYARCQWQITAPPGKRVQVHFNSFGLESSAHCIYDKLELFNGSTTKSGTFGKFCGARTPPDAFSPGNIITVQFSSDGSITQRGFRITLSVVDAGGSEPTCGIPDSSWVSGNIVGGQEASPHIWPWQVLLQNDSNFNCGGSILSKDWIITAAHCVAGLQVKSLTVIVGEHDRTAIEGTEQIYAVASIVTHEQYNSTSHDNDIALLRLVSGIHYTTVSKPICLPLTEATTGKTCYATGWGTTGGNSRPTSKVLMEVALQIINQSTCRRSHWLRSEITSTMLCAGAAQSDRYECQNDSGGPLVCLSNGTFLLHGITSWGYSCRGHKSPGVYTRVSQLTDWVGQKTNGAFQSRR